MTVRLMCGHCYRNATGAVYRRPAWRKLLRLPAVSRPICDSCVMRHYRRPNRFGRHAR